MAKAPRSMAFKKVEQTRGYIVNGHAMRVCFNPVVLTTVTHLLG